MAIRQWSSEIEAVRVRLSVQFPDDAAAVARQIDLAIACAEHLSVMLTPELLENLVAELRARAAARPPIRPTLPAVPLVCRGPRAGGLPG